MIKLNSHGNLQTFRSLSKPSMKEKFQPSMGHKPVIPSISGIIYCPVYHRCNGPVFCISLLMYSMRGNSDSGLYDNLGASAG